MLARAHLVHPSAAGRYGMHDLLRAYARELAAGEDGAGGQLAAMTSLFDYYLRRRRRRRWTSSSRPNGSTGPASSRSARRPPS